MLSNRCEFTRQGDGGPAAIGSFLLCEGGARVIISSLSTCAMLTNINVLFWAERCC